MNTTKVLWFRFQTCLGTLTYCFSKHPPKRDFLDIYLTTFWGVRNFQNTKSMRVILFFKIFRFSTKF